jgi:hypothetical protein
MIMTNTSGMRGKEIKSRFLNVNLRYGGLKVKAREGLGLVQRAAELSPTLLCQHVFFTE